MRLLGRLLLGLVLGYLVLVAGLAYAMRQPPEVFGQVMARVPPMLFPVIPFQPLWLRARSGQLRVGDEAPDFTLPTTDKARHVRLAAFRGDRPVVLVFGSYT